jgi:hypothetical protein
MTQETPFAATNSISVQNLDGVNNWTTCASSGGTCYCSGSVRRGANPTYAYKTISSSIACTDAAMGGSGGCECYRNEYKLISPCPPTLSMTPVKDVNYQLNGG